MLFDPRAMSRHLARRLALEATGVCLLLAGAGYAFTRAAYGQALDAPSASGDHLWDAASVTVGGVSVFGLGAVIVGLIALAKKLGVGMPRVVIGGDGKGEQSRDDEPSTITQVPDFVRLQEQVRQLERDGHDRDKRIALIASGTTRLEASIKEVRDLLHDILIRSVGKGS